MNVIFLASTVRSLKQIELLTVSLPGEFQLISTYNWKVFAYL